MYNISCLCCFSLHGEAGRHGGIAQLARAFGSYPTGRWFKSDCRYQTFYRAVAHICSVKSYGPMVKRLRHRPFTAVTGVRFPHGSPCRRKRMFAATFSFSVLAYLRYFPNIMYINIYHHCHITACFRDNRCFLSAMAKELWSF